ncbi:sensor histidine kinase [Methanospirillum sp.]|uniref:sensor histidine kinase n=1 Tax=Methanospirillum sp. TaxID=45200 RepID=UPI002CED17FB|nr:sensor histidine kinase [Methanospirillum sp.]HPP78622.1 sensor histidine kinase [Methanospirillum sp.]
MEGTTSPDLSHPWEFLLTPGICWFVRAYEDRLEFCLPSDEITSFSPSLPISECMDIETVFPPDIAFLLHEIFRDAFDMTPGDTKKILLSIPGSDRIWPGVISRLTSGRFSLIWTKNGNGVSEPDSCDLSEYIRNERAVRKANEKLNYFNAIVRHDILNLMMGITGYIDIIDEIVDDDEVHLLVRKSRDLSSRIRRIAELTRTYQDLGIRPPAFIEAGPSVRRILDRHEFTGKIRADVQLNGLFIYVDRMFDVVIYELVNNSLQYGGEGVRIRFSCDMIPEGLALIIEDSGPGVHPDQKERIFSRTYADRKGYGLYLASEILDITGITIRETGVYGEGARFELIFPPDTYRFGT